MAIGVMAMAVGAMQLWWLRRVEDGLEKVSLQVLATAEIFCGIIGVLAFM